MRWIKPRTTFHVHILCELTRNNRRWLSAGFNLPSTAPPATPHIAPPRAAVSPSNAPKIIRTLLQYVWPEGHPVLRLRVVAALTLLVGSKLLNIQVPFLFKDMVDALAPLQEVAAAAALGEPIAVAAVVPATLLLGCRCLPCLMLACSGLTPSSVPPCRWCSTCNDRGIR